MALKKSERKWEENLVKELDAAIALLTRARSLAIAAADSDQGSTPSKKNTSRRSKRTLSLEGREAIAAAQRKRWAKIKRQKKQAR